jgi:hypothetical protein
LKFTICQSALGSAAASTEHPAAPSAAKPATIRAVLRRLPTLRTNTVNRWNLSPACAGFGASNGGEPDMTFRVSAGDKTRPFCHETQMDGA